jgi:hypothetical protein
MEAEVIILVLQKRGTVSLMKVTKGEVGGFILLNRDTIKLSYIR